MKDNQGVPFTGALPRDYDPVRLGQMFRAIELQIKLMQEVGPIRISSINISQLPTSATGLRSGDIYSDSGTLKVVP